MMGAERFSLGRLVVVAVIHVLVTLHHISSVSGAKHPHPACDNMQNIITCENAPPPVICITNVEVGTTNTNYCGMLKNVTVNNKCTKELVKNYILEKCNGENMTCELFFRYSDISKHCEKAFKYALITYDCVSSQSNCSTIRPPNTPKPLPSLSYNIMAQKIELSTKTPPTKTTPSHKTSAINESTTSSKPDDFPATTAKEAGNEISLILASSSPGSLIRAQHSRKSCTRVTPTVATVPPKEESTKVIPVVKPSEPREDERSAGHSNLPEKFYAMILSSFMIINRLLIM